jgi:hypothetical protein
MKHERTHQELIDLEWRPQRIYRSRLEAWPTHYPEWWEGPPRHHQTRWLWKAALVAGGIALILLLV